MCEVVRLFIHPDVLSLLLRDVKRPSLWPMSFRKSGGQTEKGETVREMWAALSQ